MRKILQHNDYFFNLKIFCNCTGTTGKQALDPVKLEVVESYVILIVSLCKIIGRCPMAQVHNLHCQTSMEEEKGIEERLKTDCYWVKVLFSEKEMSP